MLFSITELGDYPHIKGTKYITVTNSNFEKVLSYITKSEIISMDCETTGLSPISDRMVGFSISLVEKQGFYFPLRHTAEENLSRTFLKPLFMKVLKKKIVWHNAKFDFSFFKKEFGIRLPITHDTYVLSKILNHRKSSLDFLAKEFLDISMISFKSVIGDTTFNNISVDEATIYACEDTDITLRLFNLFKNRLNKKLIILYKIELSAIPAVSEMELNGIKIDVGYFTANKIALEKELKEVVSKIDAYGHINLNSPQQLASLLFDKLEIKSKVRSTDVRVLKVLEFAHPIIPLILRYRELYKISSSFVEKLPVSLASDKRLHSSFNQFGTATGRFSSSGGYGLNGEKIKINLQQLPKAKAINVRKGFIVETGCYMVSVDYSQIEYRLFAALSKDENLISAYANNEDFHKKTASLLFGIPLEQVSSSDRSKGKTLNFALLYGMSTRSLAYRLGVSQGEASDLVKKYKVALGNAMRFIDSVHDFVEENYYVETVFGRRRYFNRDEDINSIKRKAFNSVVQGSAADILKFVLGKVYRRLRKTFKDKVLFISTVHDEINFEVDSSIAVGKFVKFILDEMTVEFQSIPNMIFKVEVKVGNNYGELVEVLEGIDKNTKIEDIKFVEKKQVLDKRVFLNKVDSVSKVSVSTMSLDRPCILFYFNSLENLQLLKEHFEYTNGTYSVYLVSSAGSVFEVSDYKYNPTEYNLKDINRYIKTKILM